MKHALPTMPTFYSVDGEECPRIDPARTERKSLLKDIYATKTAILDVGDILLFNTNIFHYGSANTSTTSRALLCLAFQQPDEAKSTVESTAVEATPIDGFTYHTHMSMRARKWSLGSFPAT